MFLPIYLEQIFFWSNYDDLENGPHARTVYLVFARERFHKAVPLQSDKKSLGAAARKIVLECDAGIIKSGERQKEKLI
jgi:hypothetical protein